MLVDLRRQLDSKTISAVELTEQFLRTIAEKNPQLNAYVSVLNDYAIEQAKRCDDDIAQGQIQPLTGIPYALKDIFCVKGIETTACSNILRGYIPPYSATVAERLRAGVLLGKTNTDEFTMGSSTETSAFGVTHNPYDADRVSGGSSGGSAAAVAAGLATFGLGTDTGGSIRQPAAFCGVVGLRPTYGRVSRYGAIAMASSLDTVGPITATVEDCAIVLEQIAGFDALDGTTSDRPVEQYQAILRNVPTGLRIGLPTEYFETEGLHPGIRQAIEQIVQQLKQAGHTVQAVSIPHTKYAVPTYYIICPCEVSSNLARYDGIKYGFRADSAEELLEIYQQSRAQGFGVEAKRRIMIGTYALSAGYYDAYYLKAMQVRTLLRQDFAAAFNEVDVMIAPVTPQPAFKIGEKTTDPIQMFLEDVFTIPSNLAGLPAITVPCGKIDQLPIALQVIGPQWSEGRLLQLGYQIEHLPHDS
ncbi:MAG: Asp-tRNA(Asn)/Glu-tRNA(Gln) amidotransferase subunit GatA [Candidatus Kerfeldbacteria bacterium]|nr:Asp-tRNA(Asn)/Glu-tRNA(Gln) amidotransferase subunit GatA [Candidatus Kerfeldbacteria bacterium]